MSIRYWFLVLVPAAIVAHVFDAPPTVTFVLAGIALIPLSGLLGEATEELAAHLGERWGGFLNATFGNLAELVIALVALKAGEIELVQLSIVGSIIGNLFIVLGASMLVGGIRHGTLRFDPDLVGPMVTLLFLALTTMLVPTVAHLVQTDAVLEHRTNGVAIALLAFYALFLLHRAREPGDHVPPTAVVQETTGHAWSTRTAFGILAIAAVAIGGLSEILIHHIDHAAHALGWSKFFVGLFVIPLVGNVAEHIVAVFAAAKNRMNLSIEISVGSATQIALFVTPVLLLIAPLFGQELTLVFPLIGLEAIGTAVMAAWLVLLDGKSNWLEGAALCIVAVLFGYYCY
ncbi:calcium/proton exchanger [Candidatus Uhrbacteria bacterium]|nr:calcium/proton exchanger [Candidatus Uhrbacteria bacterium]